MVGAIFVVVSGPPASGKVESRRALGQLPGEVIEVFCRCEQAFIRHSTA